MTNPVNSNLTRKAISCPCTPDCASRSSTCHAECAAYRVYETAKQAEYERRSFEMNLSGPNVAQEQQARKVRLLKKNGRWHK